MAIIRRSSATWHKGLKNGKGELALGSSSFSGTYSVGSRFQRDPGTNPEELLAAAHAACFSMELASLLEKNGYKTESIRTDAIVYLDKIDELYSVSKIELITNGIVEVIEEKEFKALANQAKDNCIISRALSSVNMELKAVLQVKEEALH